MDFVEYGESLLLSHDAEKQTSPLTRGSPKVAVSSIKAVMVHCEGPMFQYSPMFDENILHLVSATVCVIYMCLWIFCLLSVEYG